MRSAFPRALVAVAAIGAVFWPSALLAQAEPASATPAQRPADNAIRLSDAERDAILNRTTVESAAAARGELPLSGGGGRGIHGQVGVMIGSNGSHAAYGVADIPLGENGGATVSFEDSRWRGPRR